MKRGLIVVICMLFLVPLACGGDEAVKVRRGQRYTEVGGSELHGFPKDFPVPPDAQVQISAVENPYGLAYAQPATAYLSVPDTVPNVIKFFEKALPARKYPAEPCNEPVRDDRGVYSQTLVFQPADQNAPIEDVGTGGYVTIIRGEHGNTIALVEFNKTTPECADALYRLNKRLYPSEPEEQEGPPNS